MVKFLIVGRTIDDEKKVCIRKKKKISVQCPQDHILAVSTIDYVKSRSKGCNREVRSYAVLYVIYYKFRHMYVSQ